MLAESFQYSSARRYKSEAKSGTDRAQTSKVAAWSKKCCVHHNAAQPTIQLAKGSKEPAAWDASC
ncbi:MAG TPA: hypothetical protein VGY94_10530, partial [Acidobacteriaceae bacterium]|nr:hypothetical protein [Acidobacteriaceae bacterium]